MNVPPPLPPPLPPVRRSKPFRWVLLAVVLFACFISGVMLIGVLASGTGFYFVPLVFAAVLFYFSPALIAENREHPNAEAIAVLNLLLGWTVLGWIIAMVWAHTSNSR